jgi:glycosyltransferase involved in cell wall biosynthesis
MRVLYLSRWFPAPADNGSKLRALHLLQALAARHEVTLAAFVSEAPTESQLHSLLRVCAAVRTAPLRTPGPRSFDAVLGFFDRRPRSVRAAFSWEMQAIVRGIWIAGPPDVVVASQIDMAPYALALPETVRVLDEVELAGFREQVELAGGLLRRTRRQLMWAKRTAYTRRVLAGFDAYTVVSEAEQALARSVVPGRPAPEVIPNGAEVTLPEGDGAEPRPGSIIYAGSVTYAPNLEAVGYFIREILPRVRAAVPGAVFTVTGRTDGVDLGGLLEADGVRFSGQLDNVRAAIARSWLSVAPIRSGGGTRLKILESLALGTPVVSTSKGIEGLRLEDGRHVLVADDAPEFASAVVTLLRDPGLRERLGDEGRRQVALHYDWDRIGDAFCSVVEHAASARTG